MQSQIEPIKVENSQIDIKALHEDISQPIKLEEEKKSEIIANNQIGANEMQQMVNSALKADFPNQIKEEADVKKEENPKATTTVCWVWLVTSLFLTIKKADTIAF